MKICAKCGGRLKKIKTQVTREVAGQSLTFGNVPASQCVSCGEIILKRPEDFEALTKDPAELAPGILKLYYTNRPLFYFIGFVILAFWAVSTYLFFF